MSRNLNRYLDMRGTTWWFKRDIPKAIRIHFGGKTAYLRSLATSDLKVARRHRDDIGRQCEKDFTSARAGLAPQGTGVDAIKELGRIWALERLEAQEDPRQWTAKITGREVRTIAKEDVHDAEDHIEMAAERILAEAGVSEQERFLDIVRGSVRVDHHLDAYLQETELTPKTKLEKRGIIGRLGNWAVAKKLSILDFDQRTAGKYVTEFLVPMQKKTRAKHLSVLSVYWTFMGGRGFVDKDKNPWKGQVQPNSGTFVPREAGTHIERAFTTIEMRRLLYPAKPPKGWGHIGDAIRIAALSGMRQGEIIGLQVGDCANGEFAVREGKTRASVRKVPIHRDLREIVGRRFAGRLPADSMFPELQNTKTPKDAFGKQFATYRRSVGVDDKGTGKRRALTNFHSFRRWFVTEAERAGVVMTTIATVVGHKEGRDTMTFGTYSSGPSNAQHRACVEAVSLPPPLAS